MAPVGFLPRTGWMLGRPVASWGYGGPGVGAYVIVPLDGTVRVHVYAGGTVVTEPLLAGSVLTGLSAGGRADVQAEMGGEVWQHWALDGEVRYSQQLQAEIIPVDLAGECSTSLALSGTVDGPALTGAVGGPSLSGSVLTGGSA